MASHSTSEEMAVAAIDEYLEMANRGLHMLKPDRSGVYGYPSVLLLFSVVDALSNLSGYPKHSFKALSDMDPRLTDPQVKRLAKWFRHLPAHQAIIMPGTMLSTQEGEAFEFSAGEPVHIRVYPFFRLVETGWKKFDRSKIKARFKTEELPKQPLPLAGAPGSLLTSPSGCYVTTVKS